MSLTAAYWRVAITYVDRGGNTCTQKYRLVHTDTAGNASVPLADSAAVVAAFAAVSDCVIKNYQVEKVFRESAFSLPNTGTAEVEQQALISAPIAGQPNESGTIRIPGPKDIVFQAASGEGANQVNFGQTEVDTVMDMFQSAGTNYLYLSDGEQLNGTGFKGKRVHRHSTRG